MIGLGEFEYLNYNSNEERDLMWIYFSLATLLTQVMFMNTLIAILGDTYERIMDRREQMAIIQRTKIYNDHMFIINLSKKMTTTDFLYLVKPADDDDSSEWISAVYQLKKRIKNSQLAVQDTIVDKNEELLRLQKKFLSENQKEITSLIQNDLIKETFTVSEKVKSIESRIGTLEKTIDYRFDMMTKLLESNLKGK